jgi:hypothetical protein
MLAGLCLAVTGCDAGEDRQAAVRGGSELTITLPPTPPSEPAEANAAAAVEVQPQAGFEMVAAAPVLKQRKPEPEPEPEPAPEPAPAVADPPEVEVAVAPSPESSPAAAGLPAGTGNWGAYLRNARFPCGRVQSIAPVEREGASAGFRYYRVECEGGGAYQATDKRGHLYFRRWRG